MSDLTFQSFRSSWNATYSSLQRGKPEGVRGHCIFCWLLGVYRLGGRIHQSRLFPSSLHLFNPNPICSSRIVPIAYESVMLDSRSKAQLFINTINLKPASFFAKHVKHLCLVVSMPMNDQLRMLSTCSGVVYLEYEPQPITPEVIHCLNRMPLERLSMRVDEMVWLVDFTLPLFSKITHLAIHGILTVAMVKRILSTYKSLEILVINDYVLSGFVFDDPRLVTIPDFVGRIKWQAGAQGELGLWEEAEVVVARHTARNTARMSRS